MKDLTNSRYEKQSDELRKTLIAEGEAQQKINNKKKSKKKQKAHKTPSEPANHFAQKTDDDDSEQTSISSSIKNRELTEERSWKSIQVIEDKDQDNGKNDQKERMEEKEIKEDSGSKSINTQIALDNVCND